MLRQLLPGSILAALLLAVPVHAQDSAARFTEIAADAGLDFRHVHGGSGERYMAETMGAGGGFLDADGDGRLDVYLVQSGPLPGFRDPTPQPNRLYLGSGGGRFRDVTAGSGAGDSGYGMGACFGDVDNDGLTDVYVTNFGPDALLRNQGPTPAGGVRFQDVTAAAGIDNPLWGMSCAFADYDRDGCLDLYVVNYVDFALDNHHRCGTRELPGYCHPDSYNGVPDLLYRNRCVAGEIAFEDVTAKAGVRNDDPDQSKGLGVLWTDVDDDGHPDLYVANDSTRNFLYRNLGDGRFRDESLLSGLAFNDQGRTEAGMGVAAGDVDGDGRLDLLVTNLDFETNTFYRALGAGMFEDATAQAGLAGPSLLKVGFGVALFDADLDADLDLMVANGHIIDNIALINSNLSYAQGDQLFENRGGRFVEVSQAAGAYFRAAGVSRGLAAGDVDDDGDLDVLITECDGPARLLRNELSAGRRWIGLELKSRHGGRVAVGARARLVAGDRIQIAEVRAGSSYLAQSDPRLHFGLGDRGTVDRLEIRWPEGQVQQIPGSRLRADAYNVIRQEEP